MTRTEWTRGVAELAGRHDAFLIDQWGVLHNGKEPYPGVPDCLENLKRAGKRVVVLSNSPRRVDYNRASLVRKGIGEGLFSDVITSGEVAWQMLADGRLGLGRKCLLVSSNDDRSRVEGTGVAVVENIPEADFLFISSYNGELDNLAPVLAAAAKAKLPALCSNPDFTLVNPDGAMLDGPGAMARRYEEMGGHVTYIGKPHPQVYECALEILGMDKGKILAVGDSFYHDIGGAARMGIASLFITGGIHAPEFPDGMGGEEKQAALEALVQKYGFAPDFAMPSFIW